MSRHNEAGWLAIVGIALVWLASSAGGDTVTLSATQSTWLNGRTNHGDYNYGASPELRVMRYDAEGDYDSLVHFDLSSLPQNATITNVTLSLEDYKDDNMGQNDWLTIGAYEMLKSWTEGSGGVNGDHGTSRSGASWFYEFAYPDTTTWYNYGARGLGYDRASQYDALATAYHVGSGWAWVNWYGASYPNLVATVSDWYAHPADNNGWVLDWVSSSDTFVGCYFQSDNGDPNYSPKLEIDYKVIPEPSTFALAGIGTLSLLAYAARRRTARA